jgi:hypothetical protein
MFRSIFRVVVVAVVVLSFTLSIAPVAQAGPLSFRAPAFASAGGGWLEAAVAWLSRLTDGERQKPAPVLVKKATGSCIDPMGQPMPCPR